MAYSAEELRGDSSEICEEGQDAEYFWKWIQKGRLGGKWGVSVDAEFYILLVLPSI